MGGPKKIMIAAGSSGSGKTTVTCGILQALKHMGLKVGAFKCGPDYIDPMFHKSAIGIPSRNIDMFLHDEGTLKYLFKRASANLDIAVAEGVMGYYDGLSMGSDRASSYHIAKTLDMPVILVVNAKGMALSIVPLIKGLLEFRKDSNIRGVILNRVSAGVYESLKKVIENELPLKVLGYLPHDESITIDSRHLGLVTPDNIDDLNERLEKLLQTSIKCMDMEELINLAADEENKQEIKEINVTSPNKNIPIAVAKDEAFCFYYEDNMDLLKRLGLRPVYFSPLRDRAIPEGVRGLILGGGYPENYAKELSGNTSMLVSVKKELDKGLPCLAECGGYMYLHRSIEGMDGRSYNMTGFIEEDSFRCSHLVRFGYVNITAKEENAYLLAGESIKAHEFHYWDSTNQRSIFRAEKPDGKRSWDCYDIKNNTLMGYPHLSYYSNINLVRRFVSKACEYKGCD